jgi:hypothetical protein
MKNRHYQKYFFTILIFFSVLILASEGVRAAPVIFNTGVDDSGNVLPGGASDLHYIMSYTGTFPPPAVSVIRPPFPVWVTPPAGSAWIGSISSPPPGTYTYTLTFDLTGLDYLNFVLSGKWASDNTSKIFLNGSDTFNETPDGSAFSVLHDFTLQTGFQPGVNTLAFIVANIGDAGSGNPTGLLVADLRAVPIPGAVWLLGSGLICLIGLRRRLRFGERSP